MLIRILTFVIISWVVQETIHLVSSSNNPTPDLDLITAKCTTKLDFKSIEEFQDFMSRLPSLDVDHLSEPLKACLQHKEALIELKALIDGYDKERPCKHSEVMKLENYARKHFMIKKQRPWSLKFFTLFGVNIGFECKLNLLAHVKQAENEADPLDFIYSMASPTGWNYLINEHTKKTMKFGTSSNGGNSIVNRVAKLVPGLTLVEQLDYMSFDHPLNQDKASEREGVESDTFEFEVGTPPETAQQVHKSLEKIVESCQNLDQFYYNSILSLARLNELGLLASYKMVDEMHESSLMLHRWLAAASFCQVMIRVRASLAEGREGQQHRLQVQVIHDDAQLESRRTLYSYAAQLGEISDEARANVWLVSVPDGKWLRRDEAMFRPDSDKSVAMLRLNQFIRGLERDLHKQQSSN